MLFNSLLFVVFFAVVLLLHNLIGNWTARKGMLLAASYLFYATWNPPFILLLWISTAVDWWVGRRLGASQGKSKALLGVSLVVNLGLLSYFKYGGFLLENFQSMVALFGVSFEPAAPSIVLPVGISFYTFQSMSYTLDIYRGRAKPWDSFLDFALYVSFFPQLVAGPIVRSGGFLAQCSTPRKSSLKNLWWGSTLMIGGLFQKVFLADAILAPVVDQVYSKVDRASWVDAWVGTMAFSGQIYFDFAGYSLCAIGAALCLGFHLPDNFRFPYAAIGFSDFWRRWHISLSQWLRDYLYISLGGNRQGLFKLYRNLMLTMLLGGLWHGASWRFVAWGGLHGIYLVVERAWKGRKALPPLPAALLTYLLVCLTWVFFRAGSFADAFQLLGQMGFGPMSLSVLGGVEVIGVLVVVAAMLTLQWRLRDSSYEEAYQRMSPALRVAIMTCFLLGICVAPSDDRAFIYFQF